MRRQITIAALALVPGLVLTGQQARITTAADISGSSATVQVATSGSARWVQFIAPAANMNAVRYGDSMTSATRGGLIAAGGGQMLPPLPQNRSGDAASLYNLATIYVYVVTGDKVTVVWGQ
jgi:hypothetical protein